MDMELLEHQVSASKKCYEEYRSLLRFHEVHGPGLPRAQRKEQRGEEETQAALPNADITTNLDTSPVGEQGLTIGQLNNRVLRLEESVSRFPRDFVSSSGTWLLETNRLINLEDQLAQLSLRVHNMPDMNDVARLSDRSNPVGLTGKLPHPSSRDKCHNGYETAILRSLNVPSSELGLSETEGNSCQSPSIVILPEDWVDEGTGGVDHPNQEGDVVSTADSIVCLTTDHGPAHLMNWCQWCDAEKSGCCWNRQMESPD